MTPLHRGLNEYGRLLAFKKLNKKDVVRKTEKISSTESLPNHTPETELKGSNIEERKTKIKECILELLHQKAKLNLSDKEGLFPLDVAAKYGLVELIDLLVKSGGDITHKSHNNYSPIHWAAQKVRILTSIGFF